MDNNDFDIDKFDIRMLDIDNMDIDALERFSNHKINDIAVISYNKNFILNSISDYLRANNVSVANVDIDDKLRDKFEVYCNYILIKADDFIDVNYGILSKIRSHCRQNKVGLIVLGYSEQIVQLKKILDADEIIAMEMDRRTDLNILKANLIKLICNKKDVSAKTIVLAVDDNGMMLRTIKMWLEDDFEMYLANSASKALGILNSVKPNIILLDYDMPVCSGAQLYQMLKSEDNTKDIPVIFLTAKDDKDTVMEVVGLKPAGYMLKTSTKEQIVSKIEQVLEATQEMR